MTENVDLPDHNCITHWLPPLISAGLPVPRTEIIKTSCPLIVLVDGETPDGWESFTCELSAAAREMGTPCFLRTGHGSNKHQWRDTCYIGVADADLLGRHVFRLVEWSLMADPAGLPTDVWAVRELLPTVPRFYAFDGQMPIVREFRLFVRDGKVLCVHFYWSFFRPWVASIIQGPKLRDELTAFLQRCRRDSPNTASCEGSAIPSSLLNHAGIVPDIFIGSDFFAQFDDQFGLAFLDPKIRQQQASYLGGFASRDTPIPQWLSIQCTRWDVLQGWSTERLSQQPDTLLLDLLDLNEGDKGWGPFAEFFVGGADLDAKTAISIEQASTVRQDGWIVFHALHDTPGGECTQVVATFFQECPVASGGASNWRSAIQEMASLNESELEQISHMASQAGRAVGGKWSVDVLETTRGWYITDMAQADRSYHWPDCTRRKA